MIEIHPWELLAAAGMFLFTLLCVNKTLFQPFLRTIRERENRTSGQFEESDRLLRRFHEMTQAYDKRIRDEKSENYRRQEELRREALEQRAKVIAETRKKAEAMIVEARGQVAEQAEIIKRSLQSEAVGIAKAISKAVLGREIE
jgi:F-type H+-transporting ATPase subunit b